MNLIITSVAGTVLGFCLWIISNYYYCKHYELYHEIHKSLAPSTIEEAQKKSDAFDKKWGWRHNEFLSWSGIITMIVCILVFVESIMCLFDYKHKVRELQNQQEYYVLCLETMDKYDLANLGITQQVLEYNREVADIKARVETFGNWSRYSLTDWEELDYIGTK